MKKIELLSPAGDFEKMCDALHFGADAVYLGPKEFSLRTGDAAFTPETMAKAVEYVRAKKKKIYFALNIMPTEVMISDISQFIDELIKFNAVPDAFIISDPGILNLLKEKYKQSVGYHLSTQANCINSQSVKFWAENGIERIILGRELTLEDIRNIRKNIPDDVKVELEVFVHGAMCMSYSGRCLISSYFTGRNANRGDCAHPCRWKYYLMEETREGEFFPIEENNGGTYIMNSHDMCLGKDIEKLICNKDSTIVDSFKIEGRNKGTYYVSVVTAVYRQIIDAYYNGQECAQDIIDQLQTVSHRPYSKGFLFNKPRQNVKDSIYLWNYRFLGKCLCEDDFIKVDVRNQFSVGEEVEVFSYGAKVDTYVVKSIYDYESGQPILQARNQEVVKIALDSDIRNFEYGLLRKKWDNQKKKKTPAKPQFRREKKNK
ncbi:U32 family peptidase [bacterium]|nr:U32 family peptidase [bacterium]